MKEFIFLYPSKLFFDSCMKITLLDRKDVDPLVKLNKIIAARYRQKDFQINWLTFTPSSAISNSSNITDLPRIADDIAISPEDRFLDAGIRAIDMAKEKRGTDLPYVLSQLPQAIDEVVLGGFHEWDCVDKLASYLYRAGIDVFVDEDLTEKFFYQVALGTKIPLIREKWSLADLGISGKYAELSKRVRAGKPWFTQS